MLVSLNWLKNYVDIGSVSPEELAEKITKTGIEVDGIEYVAEQSKGVVVGYVESCEKHPNADKLNLCQVDTGNEKLQIVCGAPNVQQGQKIAVATPGAVLPGNFKIKKVKLRGVESNGMICSLQELGIEEKYVPKDVAEGIFVFSEYVAVGEPVEPLLNLNDAVLEFDLTPNRSDCLSMLGVAYEVAAILDKDVKLPDETIETSNETASDYISVEVDEPALNPYYGAFIIKDLQIQASPLWMRNALTAAGIRPINNVVDITNYVLLEYGQPLHAFDYNSLQSDKIVTRRAKQNEKLVTLDGVERLLSHDHLVITNGQNPIALAGVMGGANTEVSEQTNTILLESAYFSSSSVRKTVKDTGLRSESSARFEKGVDPNRVKRAGLRAAHLLQHYAGGVVTTGVASFDELDCSEKVVDISTGEVNKRLGTQIDSEQICTILTKLQFTYKQDGNQFAVNIPTRRGDISIFEDMLEEVARIYGYDNLPFTLPQGSSQAGGLTERQLLKREVKQYLQGAGLMETITYSLTNDEHVKRFISPELKDASLNPVELSMPMSEDHKNLRVSMIPELLQTITYNHARNQMNLAYFELGSIFCSNEKVLTKQPDEKLRLAGALTGTWLAHQWQQEKKQVDFFLLKGIVEGLFEFLDVNVTFEQAELPDMHPGRCAVISIKNQVIGFLGQVHPTLAKIIDIKDTFVFDIDMEKVLEVYKNIPAYSQIPKYPSVARDIAFVVDDYVQAGDIKTAIEQSGANLVKNVCVFDVYKGEHLPEGKKSVAYSLLYQDANKTLKDEEVEQSYQEIIEKVNDQFGAYVRS